MRKSRGTELDDPAIARLKHQIQEQIDEAIDLRAVAEVMITNLTIDPLPLESAVSSKISSGKERPTVPTSADEEHTGNDSQPHTSG